ncbi:cGMP-dependent protein kinase 2 [Scleropages formosus]|uniref:cGMP-dependent protein kinase 2 n=1 Tax=Scleropages formosus TaxID=113540 RepID=UPI0010FA89CA|nr:cGMP-dependent protein kinase 2 [Scleropages formosus]
MGNGSVKPKQLKQPHGAVVNLSVSNNGSNHFKDPCFTANPKSTVELLKTKVADLEKESKKKDEDICEKNSTIKELQEQLARQTRMIAEITEELQSKCIQLNKLQDVMKMQGGAGLHPLPLKAKFNQHVSSLFKDTLNRRKGAKAGVSAEPTSRTYNSSSLPKFSFDKARVWKDSSVKKLITDALNKNQFLKRLEMQQIKDMVECMYEKTYQRGDYVIKQGDPGNHLYVLAEGQLDVFQHNKMLTTIEVWTTFGELAILYNCTRTASVRAVSKVKTWALDREVFQNIMRINAQTRQEQYRSFLRSVSLLANLPEEKLNKIVDCLEVEYYDKGDYIIREGEEGSTFYVIAKGKIKVTQSSEEHEEPQTIKILQKGDYFGEKALISDDVRSASIIADENDVECLVIDRETFSQTVGTFSELQKYLQGYVECIPCDGKKKHAKSLTSTQLTSPLPLEVVELKERVSAFSSSSPFESLDVITTLGVGGFGRVELVRVKNEDVTFALKCIKKQHIVDTSQEEHIHSEKKILMETCSPFVVKLYRTFKDRKYVYMLLEACLGGEIWSLLRDQGSFDEHTAKFCVACVTEAFDYLHRNGVIYRDLKPENLLLDTEGYIKLVDFGFAKKIGLGQKTWTFCGTPEYVAPEIILNKGHDFSVDFWSLGILVFELLTGNPPFSGTDHMMTYTFILKGIEKIEFPKKITRRPEDLIRKLCRQNPTERLGNLKNGIIDIKKHRWFNGFNWEGLKVRKLPSPLKRQVLGPSDHRYFDSYPPDEDVPSDELSGWDADF